ncbi:Ameloblastin, partial [Galemys pyrenaicus]
AFPRGSAPPGMASLSLEYSKYGFGKSFNSLWLQGLLPPHSSFPWMRPSEHETQQYEYSLPVHPPPLPSQTSLQPQQPGQKPFLLPTIATAIQNAVQKGGPQPPVYQGHPPLQQAEEPLMQQQVAPSDMPPKTENTPARLGFMSSEEMPGGRGGPMAYGSMFPGFGSMRPRLRGMPHNPAMGGDFTLEFDTPVSATKGPEKGEGGAQDSPVPEANLVNPESPAFLSELAFGALGGLLASPKGSVPSLVKGPEGQSWGISSVTPAIADPLMTPGLADVYETYGPDMTTPLDLQGESTTDATVSPDTQQTSLPANKAQEPQIMHDAWHFPEP